MQNHKDLEDEMMMHALSLLEDFTETPGLVGRMKNAMMRLYLVAELNPLNPGMAHQHTQDAFELLELLRAIERYQHMYMPEKAVDRSRA